MKKKLITLLLSVSMVSSGLLPAYTADFVYADDFTDNSEVFNAETDGNAEAGETIQADETPETETAGAEITEAETLDAGTGISEFGTAEAEPEIGDGSDEDFTSEEDETAIFSDEEELPAVSQGDITQTYAAQGTVASTSTYSKGSSFGRQKKLSQLKISQFFDASYGWNWASPEYISYYTDGSGNFHIVGYSDQNLYDATCDADNNIINTVTVKLPLPKWGGFYAAPDGNFYVVVGQENPNEQDSLTVAKVLKYNRAWNLLGTADIKGSMSNAFKGIYIPFDAASLRMTQIGSTLIVHTGREMYEMDGVHHQSDITFVINTDRMELIDSSMPYVSHSFNQFVVNDGQKVYFLDHGDAYSRGLILSSFSAYAQGSLSGRYAVNIFPFMGETGDNYTGCEVTGFTLRGNTLITLGKSVPHSQAVNGSTGYSSNLNKNIFMIFTDKNSLTSKFLWLTQYAPAGSSVTLTEPKLVSVDENRYAVLYSEETSDQSILHYLLMDNSGNVLLSKSYKNVTIQTDSQPILRGRNITWVAGNYDNGNYDSSNGYLYQIPVVTTPLTGISLDQTNVTLDEGKSMKLNTVLSPAESDDVKDVVWTSSNPNAVKVSADGTIQAVAYGKATIKAVSGEFQTECQVNVQIPQTDDPLTAPTLKVSQKAADKMLLSWSRVAGAKGYQVYYKTSSKSSYKKLATVKNAMLSYKAAITPNVKYSFKVRAYGTKKNGKTKYSAFSAVKTKTATVPAPSSVSCRMSSGEVRVSWSKVEGASGYVVYRGGYAVKTLKASSLSWGDKEAYDSDTGMYWIYRYSVRAYRVVNGKRIYSKQTNITTI